MTVTELERLYDYARAAQEDGAMIYRRTGFVLHVEGGVSTLNDNGVSKEDGRSEMIPIYFS